MHKVPALATLFAVVTLLDATTLGAHPLRVLTARSYHLGRPGQPEFDLFTNQPVDAQRLDLHFDAAPNSSEQTLLVRQDDVKGTWRVELNGRGLGRLFEMEASLVHTLSIPPGALRTGDNTLSILPPSEVDDIIVGDLQLADCPAAELLAQASMDVEITEAGTKKGLPCRLTILDGHGSMAALTALPPFGAPTPATNAGASTNVVLPLAFRPGVVYTPDGHARLGLLPGVYLLYATRGFEYGAPSRRITLTAGQTASVRLQLRREVPTDGWIESDTHTHTFTYARHGDATLEERVITLAGEGIGLPISTEHNQFVDYGEAARRLGVAAWLTPVLGCEVTTARGHFNIFPVTPGSSPPDAKLTDWPKLMQAMRATPGVRVVVLNHPRNIHSNFQPFAATNFNAVTGQNLIGPEFSFDAIEVLNSSALQSDLMIGFRDWFALLNYGYQVTAVGSSDGHDVSRYIVGQGRSYVRCGASAPAARIDEACQSFLGGHVLVSLGLLAQIQVDDRFGPGDLATLRGQSVRVKVTVLGPSWTQADQVELFANGSKIREQAIDSAHGRKAGTKATIIWTLPRPRHDQYLVAIASGPPITAPYWPIARPYQPSSRVWKPRVIGATNPIWVDADGDGQFTSPRGYAQRLMAATGGDPTRLVRALADYDQAVAAQAASLSLAAGRDPRGPDFAPLLAAAPRVVRDGFAAFAATFK